jgi:hypothetical protein
MARIARDIYHNFVGEDVEAYKIAIGKYFLPSENVGINKTPFALCVDNIVGLSLGNIFKMDLGKREEYQIVDIPELKYYDYPIIICKRMDSDRPVDLSLFKVDAKLKLLAIMLSETEFEDFCIDLTNYGNSLEEIDEYTKKLI